MKYMVRLTDGTEYGPADIGLLRQWAQQRRIPTSAMLVPDDGSPPVPATDLPELASALASPSAPPMQGAHPPTAPGAPVQQPVDDGPMSTLIPYRNSPALVAYYLAVVSLIPMVGIVTGPIAFVLGIIGLRLRKRNPEVHGSVHAWIGIIGGGGLALLWIAIIVLMIALA